ncbi:MAG: transposase [Thermodesulfobacteriota bacterium]|nr:transposase [Thermodesulfobacteriota bacterium]
MFPALDWLAQLITHIPNRREHMVRYYGYYSNKSRGQRKKADQDDLSACDAQAGDGFFSQIPDYGYWAD